MYMNTITNVITNKLAADSSEQHGCAVDHGPLLTDLVAWRKELPLTAGFGFEATVRFTRFLHLKMDMVGVAGITNHSGLVVDTSVVALNRGKRHIPDVLG